jgi:hypothetical protein
MAVEIRSFQFLMNDNMPDHVVSRNLTVPLSRTYRGAVTGNGGPVLMIEGDWDAPSPQNVTYTWHRHQDLPWEPAIGEAWAASWSDYGYGFNGIAVESV